jgi:hypothetical protein
MSAAAAAAALAMLCYADRGESGEANLQFALLCVGAIVLVSALAIAPVILARRRRHRRGETVMGFTILWALVLVGSLLVTATARTKWTREQTLRIQSGYYDPQDQTDAPRYPWGLWAGLALAYAGVLAWSATGARET